MNDIAAGHQLMDLVIEAVRGLNRPLWPLQGRPHDHPRRKLADGVLFKGDLHKAHAASGAQGRFLNEFGLQERLEGPHKKGIGKAASTQ
jgi:hypothetical protein